MIRIGENLNVMVKKIGVAMMERNPKPIQDLAMAEAKAGVDYIDINLGPARKEGGALMAWVVQTVQEVVDTPLYLDTINIEAIEAGLKVYQNKKGKAVINSIMARPESMESKFPLAQKYNAGLVALLWGPAGLPRDASERGVLAAELMQKATEFGIPNEDVWIDPIVTPVTSPQSQVQVPSCVEFMMMFQDFQEMAPGLKSTCGLSNVSNGAPEHLRPILNQTYMMMLERYGMVGAIVDAFDEELKAFAAGNRPDLRDLVFRTMDGEDVDPGTLTKEQVNYIKTTKVLMGNILYSDSWLEL
ncbi:MAG: dihydropteroate synthase [Proteobacteria bacterium]|nr:dihydropteroate synthase [Pseudomonadota bacterium]MBU4372002.1 dihydropteroate synthase [Pseudomonadota bacterium]MBU4581225.1 dihydropteroate synthase [Pseudomonadota bacterium]MCG2739516.1 dihydropteroate synthase [Syntrophaceae bacterium]